MNVVKASFTGITNCVPAGEAAPAHGRVPAK